MRSQLICYGYRYYNPSMGRWLGRDPSGESGGLHLYAFCRNNAVNAYDALGMYTINEIYGGIPDDSVFANLHPTFVQMDGGWYDPATDRLHVFREGDDPAYANNDQSAENYDAPQYYYHEADYVDALNSEVDTLINYGNTVWAVIDYNAEQRNNGSNERYVMNPDGSLDKITVDTDSTQEKNVVAGSGNSNSAPAVSGGDVMAPDNGVMGYSDDATTKKGDVTVPDLGKNAEYLAAKKYAESVPEAAVLFKTFEASGAKLVLTKDISTPVFNPATNEITWNPNLGYQWYNNGSLQQRSPAVALLHEIDHAVRFQADPVGQALDRTPLNPLNWFTSYGNMEEKRVITGSETRIATALGEGVRTNHNQVPQMYITMGPGSKSELYYP